MGHMIAEVDYFLNLKVGNLRWVAIESDLGTRSGHRQRWHLVDDVNAYAMVMCQETPVEHWGAVFDSPFDKEPQTIMNFDLDKLKVIMEHLVLSKGVLPVGTGHPEMARQLGIPVGNATKPN